MTFAQSTTECCDQMSSENYGKTEKPESCHSENSNSESEKSSCGDDCTQCHSCTAHFVMNFLSPEINETSDQHLFSKTLNSKYGISYFSSNIQNIWQPPKIG